MGKKNKRPKPSSPTMAELADRHICYEEAVQCVEAEVDIIDALFKKLKGDKQGILEKTSVRLQIHPVNG